MNCVTMMRHSRGRSRNLGHDCVHCKRVARDVVCVVATGQRPHPPLALQREQALFNVVESTETLAQGLPLADPNTARVSALLQVSDRLDTELVRCRKN